MNDFVRGKTRQKDGTVPLGAEILAGGCVSVRSAVNVSYILLWDIYSKPGLGDMAKCFFFHVGQKQLIVVLN